MKKFIAMLLCGVLAVSMLAGCSSSSDSGEAAEETADAAQEDEAAESEEADAADAEAAGEEEAAEAAGLEGAHLIVGLSPTYENFETIVVNEDGTEGYEGLDIDILNALAEKCGFTYEVSNMAYSSLVAALQANQVDFVISGMCATDERKESVDFSQGYLTEKLGILFRAEDGFSSAADLDGKTVSCASGETYELQIPKIPGVTLSTFDNSATAIQELIAGRTDAVMTDGASCQKRCEENPDLSYFVMPAEEIGETALEYAIAFPKESPYLEEIDAALGELKEDGTVREIITNWLGAENAD